MTPDLSARVKDALNPGPAREEPAAAKPALTAFTLRCPYCGNEEACVAVLLNQLDCQQFRCEECSTEFSIDDLEEMFGRWQKVCSWVKAVPQFPAAE